MWNVKRDGGKVKAGRFTGGNDRDTETQRKIRVILLAVSLCLCVLIPSLIQGASLVAGWVVGWVVGARRADGEILVRVISVLVIHRALS